MVEEDAITSSLEKSFSFLGILSLWKITKLFRIIHIYVFPETAVHRKPKEHSALTFCQLQVRLSPRCASCSEESGRALSIRTVLKRKPWPHSLAAGWSHCFASWLQRRAWKSLVKPHKAGLRSSKVGCSCLSSRPPADRLWSPLSLLLARLLAQPVVLETLLLQIPFPPYRFLGNCKRVCLWPACLERSLQQLLGPAVISLIQHVQTLNAQGQNSHLPLLNTYQSQAAPYTETDKASSPQSSASQVSPGISM